MRTFSQSQDPLGMFSLIAKIVIACLPMIQFELCPQVFRNLPQLN